MGFIYKTMMSNYLGYEKHIRIYLPSDYDTKEEFKVIYMHDGQNCFLDEESSFNMAWNIHQTMEELHQKNGSFNYVIVGIDNNERRYFEYSPFKNVMLVNKFTGEGVCGGDGDKYAKFLIYELKPYIEANYRVSKAAKDNTLLGSSMGGFISLYIGSTYKNVFDHFGVLSVAGWFNLEEMKKLVANSSYLNEKYFFTMGTKEMYGSPVKDFPILYLDSYFEILKELSKKNANFTYQIIPEGNHNEKAWAKLMPAFFEWLEK